MADRQLAPRDITRRTLLTFAAGAAAGLVTSSCSTSPVWLPGSPLKSPAHLKPRVAGLVVAEPSSLPRYRTLDHYLIRCGWDQIETSPNRYDWRPLDSWLDRFPAAFAKFGVSAGGDAPGWLKAATGTVQVTNVRSGENATCCRWWTTRAIDRWAEFQAALASRYDGDQRVLQVTSAEAATVFMEPFIIGGDNSSGRALYEAGCNESTQGAAIVRSTQDMVAAWKTTRVELALHSQWQIPSATGLESSWPKERDLLRLLSAAYGEKLMLTDYGLGAAEAVTNTGTQTLANSTDAYSWMTLRRREGPIGFQLTIGSPHTASTLASAIQGAITMGACYVEHSAYGADSPSVRSLDAALKANARR
jgi:hypothetical protein